MSFSFLSRGMGEGSGRKGEGREGKGMKIEERVHRDVMRGKEAGQYIKKERESR